MLIALLLHVSLAFPSTPALAPDILRTAVAEAAGLWSSYGVAIDGAAPVGNIAQRRPFDNAPPGRPFDGAQGGPCGRVANDGTVLTIVAIETRTVLARVAAGWRGALGAMTFDENGVPSPVITVFLTDIERFIAGTFVLGGSESQWPRVLHDRVVGRVLGRVLAHEIGHFVLRTPGHAAGGLMRQAQSANEMAGPSRHGFTLSRGEVERMQEAWR
jgi:hypothetical protein